MPSPNAACRNPDPQSKPFAPAAFFRWGSRFDPQQYTSAHEENPHSSQRTGPRPLCGKPPQVAANRPLEAQPQEELCLAAVIGMRRVEQILGDLLALNHCLGCVGQFHSVATFIAGVTHLGKPMVKAPNCEPSATTRRLRDPRGSLGVPPPPRVFRSQIALRARDRRQPGKRRPDNLCRPLEQLRMRDMANPQPARPSSVNNEHTG